MRSPMTINAFLAFLIHNHLFQVYAQSADPPFPFTNSSSILFGTGTGTGVLSSISSTASSDSTLLSSGSTTHFSSSIDATATLSLSSDSTQITTTTVLDTESSSLLSSSGSSQNTASISSNSDSLSLSISSISDSSIASGSSDSSILPTSAAPPDTNTGTITAGPSSTGGVIIPSGITIPPPTTTLDTTGTEIRTSASDLSIIIVPIWPHIQDWIDDPQPPKVTQITDELDDILPKASDLLAKLPKPTDPLEPCDKAKRKRDIGTFEPHSLQKRDFLGGLFKTVFNLVTCVIDDTNKLKDNVIKGTKDVVETLTDDLKPMVDALNDVDPTDEPEPSASVSEGQSSSDPGSSSSSSSSCTLQTVSNCNIACTATAVTTAAGVKRQADGEACETVCGAPITKCGATGVTSVSTVTSTSTAYRLCSPDSPECLSNDAPPHDDPTGYLTASDGHIYLPPQTALPGDDGLQARAQETGAPISPYNKRALPNPSDAVWGGDINGWIRGQVALATRLPHGQGNVISTAQTFALGNQPDSWAVVNLYGCTSVVVVSRKRMWMSHFWEVPSFQDPRNLQPHIIGPLRNGGAGIQQGIAAFTGAGGDFENTPENKVRAFIITPNRRGVANPRSDDLQFDYEVGKIKTELTNILGRSDHVTISYVPRWADAGYPNAPNVFAHPWGKVLVQYDPIQALVPVPGQCARQISQLELWVEDGPMYRYRDYWDALPGQMIAAPPAPAQSSAAAPNPKVKRVIGGKLAEVDKRDWEEYGDLLRRQDGGSCPIASASISASSSVASSSAAESSSEVPSSVSVPDSTLVTSVLSSPEPTTETQSPFGTPIDTPTPTPTPTSPPKHQYSCEPYIGDRTQTQCSCTPTDCEIGSDDGCIAILLLKGKFGCDDQCNGCQG